jgi:hypothetical protein
MAIDTTSPRSRRAVLAGLAGGLLATVASNLGRPLATNAADGDVVKVGRSHSAAHSTTITTSGTLGVYGISDSPGGTGVEGVAAALTSGGIGLRGFSSGETGRGVEGVGGRTTGANYGVRGSTNSEAGTGVYGRAPGLGTGVRGISESGKGVLGESESFAGVYGLSEIGDGVFGESSSSHGVKGFSATGAGVRGESVQGRGGVFSSSASAQIRLQPSSAATHPSSGKPGDLFVDTSKRLWFCKGGTAWKQLA